MGFQGPGPALDREKCRHSVIQKDVWSFTVDMKVEKYIKLWKSAMVPHEIIYVCFFPFQWGFSPELST